MNGPSQGSVIPAQADALITSTGEVALLDIREAAAFGEGHPLFASHCPYSRLESEAARLVPRPGARILLLDQAGELAPRAAARLVAAGWTDVAVVEGGAQGWLDAGLGLFEGVNVPGKTLGEMLEAAFHPPTIDATTLLEWKRQGRPFAFFDARPAAEVSKMRIAGARCLPNGELAHRFETAIDDPSKPVLLTCAGRTRGLVGVLGLLAAGVPNPIFALENGTQGWALAGQDLERGSRPDALPVLDEASLAMSRKRADAIAARHAIPFVGLRDIGELVSDAERTTYVFDLRAQDEGPALKPDAPSPVVAGQLAQCADQYMAVRNARVVLLDNAGLRGAITALWLRSLGFYPVVARLPDGRLPVFARWSPAIPRAPTALQSSDALERVASGRAIGFDLRPSTEYEAGTLRGFIWATRAQLADLSNGFSEAVVFADAATAGAAASDLEEVGVAVFLLPETSGPAPDQRPPMKPEEAVDRIWFTHGRHDGDLDASRRYLAWETGLVERLTTRERLVFVLPELG